uniref:C2H2 type master regulator of conidiophore development brlA n=2 Tax=Hapsidospora chrysogena TaxID=5044 RepID=BRLA_HAPCH|nr:RecName: Full=C2H2 type master regulator of conidiophore development brlA [Hapsidospora chrysogena]AIZ05821.1 BrlA [Hapsidospora chrysogena]
MEDGFGMYSHSMSCPSTASTSFSSASSSAYDPFTPSSRRSTPNELSLDLDGSCSYAAHQHSLELTPPTTSMAKYFMGQTIKQEPEQMSFGSLPTTPMKKVDGGFAAEYDLIDMNMASHHSMGTITPSNSFGLHTISPETAMGPTSYMMTPTQSLSGSEIAESSSSWSVTNESPINFFQQPKDLSFHDMDSLDLDERHHHHHNHHQHHHAQQSPMGQHFQLHSNTGASPNSMRVQRKMMLHEAQRKTSELQRAQIRESRKRAGKPESGAVDVVRRAMCKCDYPGCNKAFRRNEHLKRHKQTFHGEGPNRFSCEFCGKDQFNRQDNLNNHRKLHARPNSRNRGVEFIPEAVPIIEHEERSRKRRAPPKSKAEKRDYDF